MAQGREPHQIRPAATRFHYRPELCDKGNRSPEQTKVLECPLLAISGHAERVVNRSALPPKADIQIISPGQAPDDVRFAPNS